MITVLHNLTLWNVDDGMMMVLVILLNIFSSNVLSFLRIGIIDTMIAKE